VHISEIRDNADNELYTTPPYHEYAAVHRSGLVVGHHRNCGAPTVVEFRHARFPRRVPEDVNSDREFVR